MDSFTLEALGVQSLVLLLVGFACFKYFIDEGRSKTLTYVFVYTFLVKICVSVILIKFIISNHGDSLISKDTEKFAMLANGLVEHGFFEVSRYISAGFEHIHYYYALVFKLVGQSTVYVCVTWIFVSSILAILIHKIARYTHSARVAFLASVSVLVYPSFFVLSVVPHRSVLSSLFLGILILSVLVIKTRTKRYILFAIGMSGLLTVRPEMTFVFFLSLAFWRFIIRDKNTYLSIWWEGIVYAFLFLVVAYLMFDIEYLMRLATFEKTLGRVDAIRERTSASGGIHDFVVHQNVLVRTVLGSAFLLVKPFPPTSTLQELDFSFLMTPSSIIFIFILPYIVVGGWESFRKKTDSVFLVILILSTILIASASIGATTERYRVQVSPFALILFSAGYYSNIKTGHFLAIYYALVLIGVILYVLIKLSI